MQRWPRESFSIARQQSIF